MLTVFRLCLRLDSAWVPRYTTSERQEGGSGHVTGCTRGSAVGGRASREFHTFLFLSRLLALMQLNFAQMGEDDDLVDVIVSHQDAEVPTEDRKFYTNPLFDKNKSRAPTEDSPIARTSLSAATGKTYPDSSAIAGSFNSRRWEDAGPGYVTTTYTSDEVNALSAQGKADPGLSRILKRGAVLWNSIDTKARPPVDRRTYTDQP